MKRAWTILFAILPTLVVAAAPSDCSPAAVAANKAVALAFAEALHNRHDAATAYGKYATPDFHHHAQWSGDHAAPEAIVQHNIESMARVAGQFPNAHREVKQVIAECNLVVIHSHATGGGGIGDAYRNPKKGNREGPKTGEQVVDIYRIDHGKVAEHWEVSQPTTDLDDVY